MRWYLYVLLACVIAFSSAASIVFGGEAQEVRIVRADLIEADKDERAVLGSDLYLSITFTDRITLREAKEVTIFKNTKGIGNTGRLIPDKILCGNNLTADNCTHIRFIYTGDFKRTVNYRIIFRREDRPVKSLTSPQNLETKFDISGFNADSDSNPGLKYKLNLRFGEMSRNNLSASIEGDVSFDNESEDIQGSTKVGVNYDLLLLKRIDEYFNNEPRYFAWQFKVKPLELEADQDLDLVDYTLKVQFLGEIPYTDIPILHYKERFGIERKWIRPMMFMLGLTYASELENADEAGAEVRMDEPSNRVDGEIKYLFPVHQYADFWTRWRWFYLWERDSDEFMNLFEAAIRIYVDKQRKTGIEIKYQKGELPPEFLEKESVQIGLTYRIF